MASNKLLNIPPAYLSNAAANILSPGTSSGAVGFTATNPYIVIKHIRVLNTDTVTHNFTLFKGATGGNAGGTQVAFAANTPVPPGQWVDFYSQIRLDSADFLTGVADVASKLVINIAAEINLA